MLLPWAGDVARHRHVYPWLLEKPLQDDPDVIVIPKAEQRIFCRYPREKTCDEREAHVAADSTAGFHARENRIRFQVEDRAGKDLRVLDVIGRDPYTQEQIVLECRGILRPPALAPDARAR